jgi:hypothetical protein
MKSVQLTGEGVQIAIYQAVIVNTVTFSFIDI